MNNRTHASGCFSSQDYHPTDIKKGSHAVVMCSMKKKANRNKFHTIV